MKQNQNFLNSIHGYNDEVHEREHQSAMPVSQQPAKPNKEFLNSIQGYNDEVH